MASSGSNDWFSRMNRSIERNILPVHSSEHEETLKADQMATKKFDEEAHIEDLNETQLKSLLDEAMDYKSPRDANDKSDTFKQLLKNVTEEDMKTERFSLGNYGLKQSNSLQNLLDDSHYQLSSHHTHQSGKKHHQKNRKNSTSVSARRLEGGSLPIDMHHSSAAVQSSDQPFLEEYKNRKFKNRKQKENDNETDEKKLMQRHFENKDYTSSSYPHDGIEMKSLSYTNSVDLEVQDVQRYSTMPASITTIASISAPLATHSSSNSAPVDRAIEFRPLSSQPIEHVRTYQQAHQLVEVCPGSTINHNNNVVLANHSLDFGQRKIETAPVQLNSQYQAVASVTNDKTAKSYQNKFPSFDAPVPTVVAPAHTIAASSHQSTSVLNSKDPNSKTQKKRNLKTNEKTIEVKSMQGYRGEEELDVLLKYIEDGGGKNQKAHPKNGIVSGQTSDHLLTAEEKKKKMAAKNKEKVNKLKKSNSMDELCSTGRHEQQQEKSVANKIIPDVTMRLKSNLTSGAKKGDKNEKSQQKRNERRSWGTEGLWTETVDREIQDEHHEVESSSSSTSSGAPSSHTVTETFTNVAVEAAAAIVTETEFHVVTKKRKVKRKSTEGVELTKTSNNLHSYNIKRDGNVRSGTRNSYNDRESGSKPTRASKPLNQDGKSTTSKNRRKSTSSMPPSDDDWNSDGGDSVQSLPIETTKTTSSQLLSTVNETSSTGNKSKKSSNPPHQQKPATFSYADIAKTNANRNTVTTSTEKWPSIIASSSSTHQNNNDPFSIANFANPELVETNNVKNKQLSNHPSEIASINTTEKPSNGLDLPTRPFDSNNNSNDDRVNSNQKISYSQSLLENHQNEIDANGNNTKDLRTLTKSKSVDQNNLSSIEHYPALEKAQVTLGEVFSPKAPVTFETYASKSKQKQAKPEIRSTKKEKLKKSASIQGGSNFSQQNLLNNCRPAVIILQDSSKPTDTDFGDITFGFDINEHLLHGQQNGDIHDSLEKTNNNDTCDIINTNLSNNSMSNQPSEMYDVYMPPIIIGDNHIVMLNHHHKVLDSSTQSSDIGYMSSSLITSTGSPPAIQNDDESEEQTLEVADIKRIVKLDGYQLLLPHFISPEPIKFNHEELVSFVNEEWLKVLNSGVYFTGQ